MSKVGRVSNPASSARVTESREFHARASCFSTTSSSSPNAVAVFLTPAADLAAGRRDAAFVEYHMVKDMCGGPRMNVRTVITPDRKLTYYAGKGFGELYDMTAERPEQRNLYDDPARAAERAALEKRLLDEQILREDERRKPTAGA